MTSIKKVSARVFCQLTNRGGNPISVFYGTELENHQRLSLAKTCPWESVFLSSKLRFYMPTGEQVAFCAHAAMGGAFVGFKAGNHGSELTFDTADCGDSLGGSYRAAIHDGDVVSMHMKTKWTEGPVETSPLLHRMLREFHGAKAEPGHNIPTLLNSSIVRPKTLVHVRNVDDAQVPPLHESYRQACDAIGSTGLYLYSERASEPGAWDCVSFVVCFELDGYSNFHLATISSRIWLSRRPRNGNCGCCFGHEFT